MLTFSTLINMFISLRTKVALIFFFFPLTGHKMESNWKLYFSPSEFGNGPLQAGD